MRFVAPGNSVWMCDPNDPEAYADAIGGGLVLGVDEVFDADGVKSEVYRTARNRRGQIVFTEVREDQVVTHYEHLDRALAANIYRALAKDVALARRASVHDLRKLRDALQLCEMWNAEA